MNDPDRSREDDLLLAALLADQGIGGLETTAIAPRSDDGPAPLSFAQQRLWFLQRFAPASTAYNLTRTYRLTGTLDRAALEQALHAVIERHAILRTRFIEQDGEARQNVLDDPGTVLVSEDLSTLPADARAETLARRLREHADQCFDLERDPPLRALLLCLGSQEHVLAISLHHIVSDGQSNPILARDLLTAYGGAMNGSGAALPAPAIQYADYAAWQRRRFTGERLERELSYWTAYLGHGVPALELPTDRPRSEASGQRGDRVRFTLPPSTDADLRAFCRAQGCTPFVVLLAAWQLLLGRYSGQRDFAVGVPNGGRARGELQELVGFFVNTQVYRARLSPELTVARLCHRLRDEARAALDHAELPFELLLDRLAPAREPGRSPVFQTMFNLQVAAPTEVTLPGLTVQAVPIEDRTAKFDLSLDLFAPEGPDPAGIRGEIEFASDLFDRATVDRMAGHFERLLASMLCAPDQRIDGLGLLDADAVDEALHRWNDTQTAITDDDDVLALFERRAQEGPDRTAGIFEDGPATYAELNRRANRLGHWLVDQGVGAEDLVGVCLPRRSDLVVALLASLKAGGAYLPIDPDHPRARNGHVVDHARPRLVLACEATRDRVGGSATVHTMERIAPLLASAPDEAIGRTPHPRQLAYTLYTSGSTGVPKGVQVDRRAFANFLRAMRHMVGMTPDDRLLAVTTIGFDISGLEIFLPLTQGACCVLASRAQATDPQALARMIAGHHITVMQATPATWRMMVDQGEERWPGLKALCGGEALSADLATRLLDREVRLLNVYGPTETTVWSSAWPVDMADAPVTPIGHPIANTGLYVLDDALQPVPTGVAGELYIGGLGLARGYRGQPGLTATAFVPNPFDDPFDDLGDDPGTSDTAGGSRLYRSGDLARRRRDGTIEFLGRRDHQIKVRGFRIEAGEVETALMAHPGIRQAVVTAHTPPDGDTVLCAHVVAGTDAAGDDDQGNRMDHVRAFLRERLPAYMVPTALVPVDALPLNASGKVDRAALPAPAFAARGRFEPPATDTETRLIALWRQVLGIDGIGAADDFFLLGGQSLQLVRLQARIRAAFDRDMPLAELFGKPVLRDMAGAVDGAGGSDKTDDLAFMTQLLETL